MEQKFIYSEQYFIASKPTEIVTVLGSCVAVCLFDKDRQIGGMNHYLIPLWNGIGLKSLRFGNISTLRLIDEMLNSGARVKSMEAKVFGGAVMNISDKHSVGPRNVQVAFDVLKDYNIPIISHDVGGDKGRKIHFNNTDGSVYLKYSIGVKDS